MNIIELRSNYVEFVLFITFQIYQNNENNGDFLTLVIRGSSLVTNLMKKPVSFLLSNWPSLKAFKIKSRLIPRVFVIEAEIQRIHPSCWLIEALNPTTLLAAESAVAVRSSRVHVF